MSLTWRLIISYIVVIAIALALAFVTLALVARPIQNRLQTVRLAAQSKSVARQLNTAAQRGLSVQEMAERMSRLSPDSDARLILLDPQGAVLADTENSWLNQTLTLPQQGDTVRSGGTLTGPDDQRVTFATTPIGPENAPMGTLLAVTSAAPALPRFITELGWGFVLAGLVAGLVSLLASVLIARSFALPLQKIAAATGGIAAGDYSRRVPEKGPPEVRRVAASFNVMAHQVDAGQQAMRDFVSNVSHELKTPLTSIQGFSQAILEGATPDEATQKRAAGIIHAEAHRLSRLVEDLLDLARIDSGQVVMQKTPLDLTKILSHTADRLRPQAQKKAIQLVEQWQTIPPVVGDGDRLAQVFTNLLDNAVRHTPPGGKVTVSTAIARSLPRPRHIQPGGVQNSATTTISERGDFVTVSISDTGPGIPPEELARIFERFYQVDKSRKRGSGTGLGLAIIREIVDAHSGTVRAESVEGVGTKFTVLLPITEADARTLISARK